VTERKHVDDGARPTVSQIKERYVRGDYDHAIDPTIASLIDHIDLMSDLLRECQDGYERALNGWRRERAINAEITNRNENN
jgi:predicted hydrocarbon binding protein